MRHSVIPWIGGKHDQGPWIVARFPSGYAKLGYIEPFAGSLAVFLCKEPSNVEVINDKDKDVQNLWNVIQKDGERLAEELDKLLYARAIYDGIARSWFIGGRPVDPLERAIEFYYLCRSSFAAKMNGKGGWAKAVERNAATTYRNSLKEILWAQGRLKNAMVDCGDFRPIIKSGDSEKCLIYCDPPFVESEHYYAIPFDETDHRDLARMLNKSAAKIAVSYYEHPLVAELYPEGKWTYNRRKQTIDADGSVRGERRNHEKRVVTELLITNYKVQLNLFG